MGHNVIWFLLLNFVGNSFIKADTENKCEIINNSNVCQEVTTKNINLSEEGSENENEETSYTQQFIEPAIKRIRKAIVDDKIIPISSWENQLKTTVKPKRKKKKKKKKKKTKKKQKVDPEALSESKPKKDEKIKNKKKKDKQRLEAIMKTIPNGVLEMMKKAKAKGADLEKLLIDCPKYYRYSKSDMKKIIKKIKPKN